LFSTRTLDKNQKNCNDIFKVSKESSAKQFKVKKSLFEKQISLYHRNPQDIPQIEQETQVYRVLQKVMTNEK